MKILTLLRNYKKTAFAFLAVLFCLMMKTETSFSQFCNTGTLVTDLTSNFTTSFQNAASQNSGRPYWTFTAVAGNTYSFSTCTSGVDTYLRLYSGTNQNTANLVVSNDDNGPYCNTTSASLDWTCTTSGLYSILLTKYSCVVLSSAVTLQYKYAVPALRATFTALDLTAGGTRPATSWCAGETRNVLVTVQNTGTSAWTSGGTGVNFSYWWTPGQTRDFNPRILPFSNLLSGASQTITIPITAPASGPLVLNFDLVKEGSCWFADNVAGCSGPGNSVFQSSSITINPLPSITTAANTAPVCINTGSQITTLAYSAPTNSPTTYSISWNAAPTNSFAAVTNAALTASPLTINVPAATAAGTYTGNISVKNGNSCSGSSTSFTVTVNPLPSITPSPSTAPVCFNTVTQTTTLAYNAPTNSPTTYSISWNAAPTNSFVSITNAALTASPITINVPAGTAAGTYTGNISVKNSNSCASSSAIFTVTVNSKPVAGAITGAAGICIGSNTTLTSNATGTGTLTYIWSSSNTTVATVTNAGVVTGASAGTTNITYTVTDANGCSATSAGYAFTVSPTAGAITGATGSCAGNTVNLTSHASGIGTLTYVWNSSNISVATVSNSGVVSALAIGSTNITYTVTDGNGCTATSPTFPFSVTAPAANAITAPSTSVCVGSGLTLTSNASGTGTLTYTWLSSNTAVATVSGTAATTTVNGVSAGTVNITYTVTDGNGCSATSAAFAVTVNPKPVAGNITGSSTVCQFSSILLTANATGTAPFTYTWSSSNTGIATVNNTGAVTAGTTNGTTNITYTVTDANGCSSTSAAFTVTVSKPTANAITGATKVCIGSGITLTSNASGTGTLTYTWLSSNTAVATVSGTASTTTVTGAGTGTTNITYTVTDGNGCSTTSAAFIVTVTKPTANAITAPSTSVCIGSGLTLTSNASGTGTLTYAWSSSNTAVATVSGTAATTTVNGVSAGTTNITYTVTDGNGCSTTSTAFIVTVNPKPVAGNITGSGTVCQSSSITLTANATGTAPFTYTWSSSNTGIATVNNVGIVTAGTTNGTTNITYAVTDANGCSSTSAAFAVTVSKPTASAVTGSSAVCIGSGNTLTSHATGTGTLTYIWSSSNTAVATVSGTVSTTTVTGAGTGTTNITYTVTDGNGCSTTSAAFIVTVTKPTANAITAPSTSVCIGSGLTLTSNASGTGTLTYAWSSSNTAVATVSGIAATTTVNGVSAGTANITYTVTDGNGCSATSAVFTVTVNPLPSIIPAATAAAKCFSSGAQTTTLAYTGSTNSPTTYSINYNAAANAAGFIDVNNTTLPASPISIYIAAGTVPGTYTGKLTVANANGCNSSSGINFTVAVNALPTPTLTNSPASPVCANANVTYTTETGQSNYAWTFTGTAGTDYTIVSGGNSTSNTAVISWITSGTKTVNINYTNSNTCTAVMPTSNSITVLAIPTGTFSATENSGTTANDNIICTGDAVTFTAPSGYGSYTFKLNGTIVQGPNTDNTYSTTTLTNGQSVTVDVANASNCGVTFGPIAITVNPLPSPTLSSSKTSICPGDNVIFSAGGGNSYNFKVNGSPVQSGTSNTYSSTTLTNGNSITVDVTNANGCIATSSAVVITVNALPSGSLSASPGNTFCAGTNVTFTATAGTGNTYNFKVNGTTVGTPGPSNTFSTSTLTNGQVVTVVVTNSSTCSTTFNPISVTVNPIPTGTLTATENSGVQNDNIICAGAPVTFTATSGFASYDFQVNGVSKQNTASNTYTASTLANNDMITVVVKSNSNCSSSFNSITITVIASPTGTLIETDNSGTTPNDNIICAGDNAVFTATTGFNNYNFQVNGTTVQNGAGNTFSTTTLANGDVITVDVTNANSCITTFNSITITVNPLPTGTLAIAENAGTPNDGIICTGTPVTFTAPNGFTNYNFLLNGASVQNGASKTYTTTTLANNDKVTVAVTNSGGCIGILNQYTITVNPLPTVAPITTTAPSFDVCIGSTITLQDATNTGGTFTWNSENTGIATVNASTGAVTGVAAGTAVIDYAYTNSNGCSSTVTATVTVHALPIVQPITGFFNICKGTTTQLLDATAGGIWSSDNTSVATVDASGNVTGIQNGTANISYTVTDGYGCTTTVSAAVTVSTIPTVAPINGPTNICMGSSVQYTDATTGGTWSVINGTGTATITPAGVLTGITAGTVIVSYGISSSCGLPAFTQQTVNVNTPPSATISYAGGPFCTSSGTVSVTQTGTTGGTYSSTSGLTINTSNGTITPATSTAGTYTVTYTIPASATGGCGVYTATTSVTITAAPTITSFSYSGTPFCSTVTSASPSLVASSTGGTYSSIAGLTINTSTGVINPSTSTAGTYTIIYTIAASGGCAAVNKTTSITITANPTITNFTYSGTPYCSTVTSASPSLTASSTGGTYSYTVTSGGPTLTLNASTGVINPSTSSAGIYAVTYTIAAINGCVAVSKVTSITINSSPTAVAGTAVATCSNNPPVNITAGSSATNYSTIIWTSSGTGTFTNANSLTTATYTPSSADISAGSVTLTLTANGNGGCAAAISTKTLTISAPPAAFIITPSNTQLCLGNVQSLTATASASMTGSMTFSSTNNGTNNVAIPDATGFTFFGVPITLASSSVTTNMSVSTVPAGAVINSMSVTLNVTHPNDNDLVFNVKAPNGSVLDLVHNRGNTGKNFTNTVVSSASVNPFTNLSSSAPFTGTYAADAVNGVGTPNSTVTNFSSLFSIPNGTWTLGAEDDNYTNSGIILNWSITFNYTIPNSPLSVTWSPITDLYTDAGATTAYAGTALSTIYAKPSTTGNKTYTAIVTNAANCSTIQTATLTINPTPVITITADYCAVAGKVQLTANSSPVANSYLWSTGETTQTILVDIAGNYTVTAYTSLSCPGTASINIANELVANGNFEAGDAGFATQYTSRTGSFYTGSNTSGLYPEGYYAVDTSANSPSNGIGYHPNFWGHDHTTGHGKYMIINGSPAAAKVWQQTVSVLPNTTYYFSAWGMSLNNAGPFAQLQFNVNGAQVGSIATLTTGVNNNSNNGWIRFYGTLTTGANTTSAIISITDLQTATGGNDFGLDDISFSTLSTFVDLQSAPGTDAQTVCVNNAIQNIVYSAGSSSTAPTVSPLPAGVTSSWNGVYLTISGTPTVAGNYTYTVTTTGSCQPASASGTITVQAQKITLSSGAASPSVCINSPMANIVFTLSGTATGAATTGLPAGVTGVVTGSGPTYTYTISGTPTAAAGAYPYTVTTSGTCTPVTFNGTITVTSQTITLNSANNTQTVCINSPIANIQYTVGGTGSGATVTGLPPGVTGSYNSGLFIISGSPTSAAGSPYTYMVTTSGTCATATATGTITVTPGASFTLTSGAATNPQTVCKGAAITNITYTVSNAAGASATGLPAGVTGAYSGGVFTISGTPTVAPGTYSYTITSSGGCGVGTTTGSIIVQAQTISLASGTASQSVCANTAMANIIYTIGGTATGASVTGLPAGVTGTLSGNQFIIGGTPTAAAGPYSYTVTTSGTCSVVTATGTITIQAPAVGGTLTSVSICSGSSGTLTLTGQSGTITRWEVSTDFGTTWTQIANTAISQNFSNVMTTTMYRVLVSGCGTVYSSIATVGVHNLWTGRTSTDWNVTSNWSDNLLPSASCTTVMIPSGTPNQPLLTSSVTVPNLMIAAGTSVNLNGQTLEIDGTFTGSTTGFIKSNASSGLIIGGSASTLYFDPSNNYIKTLTLNSSSTATLGDSLNIAAGTFASPGTVTVNSGSTLTTGSMLTIKSNAGGDGRVGQSSGTIAGNVTVERYIPPKRAWRFLAVPFSSSSQTINKAWQEGASPNPDIYTHNNPKPGFGTEITYDNLTAHGFDVNTTLNSSLYYWDSVSTGGTWTSIPSTYLNINSHQAYYLFVRGSRAIDLSLATSAVPDQTVLRSIGSLNEVNGSAVIRNSGTMPAGSFFFTGNPYASPVNLNNVIDGSRTTGFNTNQFWVWDPKLTGTKGVGAYVTYSNGVFTPDNGETGGSYAPTGSPVIQSGQAFFVQMDNSHVSTSLEFHQSDKNTAPEANVFGAQQSPPVTQSKFYTNLMLPSGDSLILVDGVAAAFAKDNNAGVDSKDANKMWNISENIALIRDNNWLAIEFRPVPVLTDTLFYTMYLKQQPYALKISTQDVPSGFPQAWLVDKYLNTRTALNTSEPLIYNFVPNSDTNSYRNRFMLVFKRTLKAIPVATTMSSGGATAATLEGKVDVFPNPVVTGGKATLKFTSMKAGKYEVTVSSLDGKALTAKTIQHEGGNYNYDLQLDARWATGTYLVTIKGENGYTTTVNLIIGK